MPTPEDRARLEKRLNTPIVSPETIEGFRLWYESGTMTPQQLRLLGVILGTEDFRQSIVRRRKGKRDWYRRNRDAVLAQQKEYQRQSRQRAREERDYLRDVEAIAERYGIPPPDLIRLADDPLVTLEAKVRRVRDWRLEHPRSKWYGDRSLPAIRGR